MTIILQAWVRGSSNAVPIAQAEFRSPTLVRATKKLWIKEFRVEEFEREDIVPDSIAD
jgi:hypothetical protein